MGHLFPKSLISQVQSLLPHLHPTSSPFLNLFTVVSAYHVPPHVHVPPIAFPPSLGVGFGHVLRIPPPPPLGVGCVRVPPACGQTGGGEGQSRLARMHTRACPIDWGNMRLPLHTSITS